MPIKTPHYGLEAFGWGDIYSARVDARRFTIIDNQIAFISDLIGPGIITGWDLVIDNNGNIIVTDGIGIIGRKILKTFGASEIIVDSNSENYIYMKEKINEVGEISSNSEIANIVGENLVPPSSPTGLKQESSIISYLVSLSTYDSELITYLKRLLKREDNDDEVELNGYKEISFSWDENTEEDFSHYKIIKVIDGDNLEYITTENIYADTGLVQDTDYNYQVISIDLSGNESDPSNIIVRTDVDVRVPLPPTFIEAFPSDGTFEIIWDQSFSDNVDNYKIEIQLLDDGYEEDGNSSIHYISSSIDNVFESTYAIFSGLINNRNYRITISSISLSGISSEGISISAKLLFSAGAGEVNSLDVSFEVSDFEDIGIETDVSWRYLPGDPYLLDIEMFLITFIENGTRVSDPIEVLPSISLLSSCSDGNNYDGSCYSTHIKYIPFENNGIISYESIKEYTPYVILIQTKDLEGNISSGFIYRVERTPISSSVPSIGNFVLTRKTNNTLYLSWDNPENDYFSYNTINITITDLSSSTFNPSDEGTTYLNNVRIGRTNEYTIPSNLFNINYRYTIIITSYDVFDSEGEYFEYVEQFTDQLGEITPPSPGNLLVTSGDTEVNLKWDPIGDEFNISYYKIYRANYQFYLRSTDFEVINTIPSTLTSFTDFTVINDNTYNYFVTSVDIYGNESLNPSFYGYISTDSFSAEPRSSSSMTKVEGLEISVNSNEVDAELSWNSSVGNFDGYEILRSDENNYSFRTVGYAFPGETTFIDSDAILKNDTNYYYIIRKFKNDTNVFITTSSIAPSRSIFIGKVISENNVITFDISDVVNLVNFEDPIRSRTESKVLIHNHKFSNGFDRRINLRSNSIINSWITYDFSIYQTEKDIEGATNYVVKINGVINEEYFKDNNGNIDVSRLRKAQMGESPIEYEIDINKKTITFNEPLYTSCIPSENNPIIVCPVTPYISIAPTVSLEMIGLSEVDGLLNQDKIEDFSATKVSSGVIESEQMPSVYHRGRVNENLIPLRLPMQTFDNISYSLSDSYDDEDRNKMGNSVTFYDIIFTGEEDQLLAATSSGIWVSNNLGNDWELRENFPEAVHRVYKSNIGDFYAITNYNVYKSNGTSFRSWKSMTGLEYVKNIRDIDEDSDGNIYISTDLGIFRLNGELIPYIEDSWEKLSIFGARSSEVYAIIVDEEFVSGSNGETGRILASNELGLIESIDNGRSWSYIGDLESNIKIWKFIKNGNFIFALADDKLYRQEDNAETFIKIADIDANLSRKIEIFNDKIYISTDKGSKVSVSSNIYVDEDIEFISVWPKINIKNNVSIITSLNIIEGILFIGTDRRLFIFNENGEIWLQYEQFGTVIPTFYVDNSIKKLGYYYNNIGANHNVQFDEILSEESIVEVSNKYDIYVAKYGGWAKNKYDAEFHIYRNGIEFGKSKEIIPIDVNEFLNIIFPEYTDYNSHKEKADLYKEFLDGYIESISSITEIYGDEVVELIKNIYKNIELFFSQLYNSLTDDFVYPSINADIIKNINVFSNYGEIKTEEVSVYYETNQEKGTNYSALINIVNGVAIFDIPFDKYDNISIDILGVGILNSGELLHRDIEDAFELAYSGLPSYLSQVQQINISKLGIFVERQWPGQQDELSTLYQMKSIIPVNDEWYDTLNSTINYREQISIGSPSLSLPYVTSTIYIEETNTVLVGGQGGVLSIDVDNLNISEVYFTDIYNQKVRKIFRENDNIYILTDTYIYLSQDFGVTWEDAGRDGLPNQLYSIGFIGNNLMIGASDGIYAKSSLIFDWTKSVETSSPVTVMLTSNLLYVVINGNIFASTNGYSFTDTGVGADLDIIELIRDNYINMYVATKQGLYSDNGSLNSSNPVLTEINLSNFIDSDTCINNISTNDLTKIVIGTSSGTYILIENDIIKSKENTSLNAIHKSLIVNGDIWLFGYNSLQVPYLDYPIILSTGVPF